MGDLFKEMHDKTDAILTPEQKEKLKTLRPPREEKKPESK
jgi:hypothetical protein